ncbi:MAG: class I SAM-dependent methyltransferase [Planctomycetes bacterium]|nr:class I SAM-dependent methyltransferase [Planctomycetota bacterium]
MTLTDPSAIHDRGTSTHREIDYRASMAEYFDHSMGSTIEKLENFTKYVPRQRLAHFLALRELFGLVLEVHGSIVECGVYLGGGLFSFAQLSAILEPVNYQRKIIGFDTFEGLLGTEAKDAAASSHHAHDGGLAADSQADILAGADLFDQNRFLAHLPKISLVRGDLRKTAPAYLREHPHTVVSLLYLDLDLYAPTKAAIEAFVPRMPKGAVIAFDELNMANWPGETTAVLETIGLGELSLRRFPFDPALSYAVL